MLLPWFGGDHFCACEQRAVDFISSSYMCLFPLPTLLVRGSHPPTLDDYPFYQQRPINNVLTLFNRDRHSAVVQKRGNQSSHQVFRSCRERERRRGRWWVLCARDCPIHSLRRLRRPFTLYYGSNHDEPTRHSERLPQTITHQ